MTSMVLGGSFNIQVLNTKCECTFSIITWGFLKAHKWWWWWLCCSGIDQPSITYGPGYFKTRKEPVVIMQEAGGKNQSFHGRLFDVFNLWEVWFIYQNWVTDFWESWLWILRTALITFRGMFLVSNNHQVECVFNAFLMQILFRGMSVHPWKVIIPHQRCVNLTWVDLV